MIRRAQGPLAGLKVFGERPLRDISVTTRVASRLGDRCCALVWEGGPCPQILRGGERVADGQSATRQIVSPLLHELLVGLE